MTSAKEHFSNRSPSRHIVEKFSRGAAFASERHGLEISGTLAALIDSLKGTLAALILITSVSRNYSVHLAIEPIALIALGLALWQGARSSWLGYFRLDKLHREMLAEKDEIATSRDQERAELQALYSLKGFDPPLLDRVVEVLMADDDRLLKVMLEEELGMSLATCDHPIKQGMGALVGAGAGALFFVALLHAFSPLIAMGSGAFLVGLASAYAARLEGSAPLAAFFWNCNLICSLAALSHIASCWLIGK